VYLVAIPYLLHSKHCSKETGTKSGQDQVLDVPIAFFFDGLEAAEKKGGNTSVSPELLEKKETIDLVRAFHEIPEDKRKHLFDLTRALSETT
jgi:hypothetical protein